MTNKPIVFEFKRKDFEVSEMPLLKLAAFEKIKSLPTASAEANKLSINY